jgi:hypothetical protein
LLLAAAALGLPLIVACGGGEEEAPRPVAHAADHGSGTYWGGGGGGGGTGSAPSGGSLGLRVGGGSGGALGDAMRRRRADREAEMRERLGPVRLSDDGSELWPLYEDAVRRMERDIAAGDDETDCERALTGGESLVDEMTGDAPRIGNRERRTCRGHDEDTMRCADEEYAREHDEECAALMRRAAVMRRELRSESRDEAALERASRPTLGAARRGAGARGADSEEEAPEAEVLPELDIPSRGDGTER